MPPQLVAEILPTLGRHLLKLAMVLQNNSQKIIPLFSFSDQSLMCLFQLLCVKMDSFCSLCTFPFVYLSICTVKLSEQIQNKSKFMSLPHGVWCQLFSSAGSYTTKSPAGQVTPSQVQESTHICSRTIESFQVIDLFFCFQVNGWMCCTPKVVHIRNLK